MNQKHALRLSWKGAVTSSLMLAGLAANLAPFASAAEAQAEAQPAPTTQAPATPARNWLDDRGTLSMEALLNALNTDVQGEQRVRLERALAERNAALQNANEKLSAELRKVLATDDTRRVNEAAVDKRLDKIRRLQPGRYHEMQKKLEAQKARSGETPAEATPVTPPGGPNPSPSSGAGK